MFQLPTLLAASFPALAEGMTAELWAARDWVQWKQLTDKINRP